MNRSIEVKFIYDVKQTDMRYTPFIQRHSRSNPPRLLEFLNTMTVSRKVSTFISSH